MDSGIHVLKNINGKEERTLCFYPIHCSFKKKSNFQTIDNPISLNSH